ncbi:MAG: BLUF domain-containing protein [Bacteroidota bacterium]|nr:BLUF domain-containing protein [Bacteroidota bacterium]
MYYTCYTSIANNNLDEKQILDILNSARKNNIVNGITGMLLYIDDNFIQIIEGNKEDVNNLYQKIINDDRHLGVKIISQGNIKERFFPNWVMGFKVLTKYDLEEMVNLNGVGYFTIEDLLNKSKPHIAIEFLKSFYKNGELDFLKFWKGQ